VKVSQKTQDNSPPDSENQAPAARVRDTTLVRMRDRVGATSHPVNRFFLRLYTAILVLCAKTPVPTVRRQRLYAVILMVCQGGITFTGSLVRVTGSGLGCPTWPQCHPGSLVPEAGTTPAIHQAIEFGNRMLTFVLIIAALVAFLAVLRAARRNSILHIAFLQGLGIIAQAVIGGITVHLDLAWWIVMAHFLPSMVLVFFAAVMVVKIGEDDDSPRRATMPKALRWATWGSALTLAVTLVTGTMTTSSGPHAGDEAIQEGDRLQIALFEIANLHAHAMYLYMGITIGLLAGLLAVHVDRRIKTAAVVLIIGIILQGIVGVVQYNLGVPRWTVPPHVLGSAVVAAATGLLWSMRFRRGEDAADRDYDTEDTVSEGAAAPR
jgi:cytochrome c oxidase assembly protein subunit 15